jgi:cysteine desulfurase
MEFPIYLDYNATTPIDPEVLDAMIPYFKNKFGNPASKSHKYGWEATESVEFARKKVAGIINAEHNEIIFTSGSTESINLALKGLVESLNGKDVHIITSKIEHRAVLDVCEYLNKYGVEVTYLDVDKYGFVNPDDITKEIRKNTVLVSIMTANNEVGTIQPIGEIGKICNDNNVLFHTDATQAVGKIPIDVNGLNIDLLSFSAHKIYGPKGVGALFIKNKSPKIKIKEQINGGGHENGLRSGTLNVPAIVGFGKACEICKQKMFEEYKEMIIFRDRFINNILQRIKNTVLNGHPQKRLPNNMNICFKNIDSTVLMSETKELAFSSGSACTSADLKPSYVLSAMNISEENSRSSARFSIGRFTTNKEMEFSINKIVTIVEKIRKLS